ncbi:DDE-type integrase/transposase/recombinase [Phormidium sp. FACHB-592]|uniref:DDE-type integrase/transposase/recombinase n=1 Tax=Stenomitos frigidus AS-A4 TaxID=2933935 RepID=A0ABV0KKF9_9CYAN|nr:DDE-type integrase/transposase/recombinase [Phormidium sp. FACHB-592]MBD2077004.1 DDE-type integrase/transposase/recombinase [Phormidium sp. FACHB-592]
MLRPSSNMEFCLFERQVIKWEVGSEHESTKRVLWIDINNVFAFIFDLNVQSGFPEVKEVAEILEAVSRGTAIQIRDPWERLVFDNNFSSRELAVRDKAWNIISPIVEQEPDIYYRDFRGSAIKKIVEAYNIDRTEGKLVEKTVYSYLRRYFQRGKTINALLPDYSNSAGKGKPKGFSDKKRGRPRQFAHDSIIGPGINLSEEDQRNIRLSLLTDYCNLKENSLDRSYDMMLARFYSAESFLDEKGVQKVILQPQSKVPSLDQYKDFYYRKIRKDIQRVIISRKGTKYFEQNARAITGSSRAETVGAGSRFQIDATILGVYAASKFTRIDVIGRPVVYVVIDVSTEMITGLYVGLEGPSWTGAMMALANCAEDKVEFCQRYGINIMPEEWPCHHLPKVILGDRGELVHMPVEEKYIPNLHIAIENAPSGRPDWKGLIEGCFRRIQGHIKPYSSGFVDPDYRQKGQEDYRRKANLDIDQITAQIIRIILFYNNENYLKDYELDQQMLTAGINPIPRELWHWMINKRSGGLRPVKDDLDYVCFCLMPTRTVTLTENGIKLPLNGKALYYRCDRADEEGWLVRARNKALSKSEKKLTASLDLRKTKFIYLHTSDGKEFEKCYVIDPQGLYEGKHFEDTECKFGQEKLKQSRYEGNQRQAKVNLMTELSAIDKAGADMTQAALQANPTSGAQRVADMSTKKAIEKFSRSKDEGFEIDKSVEQATEQVNNQMNKTDEARTTSNPTQLTSYAPDHLDILLRSREENQNGGL